MSSTSGTVRGFETRSLCMTVQPMQNRSIRCGSLERITEARLGVFGTKEHWGGFIPALHPGASAPSRLRLEPLTEALQTAHQSLGHRRRLRRQLLGHWVLLCALRPPRRSAAPRSDEGGSDEYQECDSQHGPSNRPADSGAHVRALLDRCCRGCSRARRR